MERGSDRQKRMCKVEPDPGLTAAYREFNQAKLILTVLSCSHPLSRQSWHLTLCNSGKALSQKEK